MKLYVETRAVVAWLRDEEHDDGTTAQLVATDVTFTSDLTHRIWSGHSSHRRDQPVHS